MSSKKRFVPSIFDFDEAPTTTEPEVSPEVVIIEAAAPVNVPQASDSEWLFVDEGSKVNPNGDVLIVGDTFIVPGKLPPLLTGYRLHECMDGYYAVIDNDNKKLFYRLGPTIIKKVPSLI